MTALPPTFRSLYLYERHSAPKVHSLVEVGAVMDSTNFDSG